MSGYERALCAAGAAVFAFGEFGSYQGDWFAKVEYNGIIGWVHGSFGSCESCDAFYAEFEYISEPYSDDAGKYFVDNEQTTQEVYLVARKEYDAKLAELGRRYLNEIISQQEAEKIASKNQEWDMGAENMIRFVKENSW